MLLISSTSQISGVCSKADCLCSRRCGRLWICMWILERRFPADFGRREYRKINAVSENKNANVDIIIKNGDGIRKEIIDNLALVK